jgi:hypothetical protein
MGDIVPYVEVLLWGAERQGNAARPWSEAQVEQVGSFLTDLRRDCLIAGKGERLDEDILSKLPAHLQQQVAAWCAARDLHRAQSSGGV